MNLAKTIKTISYIAGAVQIIGGVLSVYGLYKSSFNENYELINSLMISMASTVSINRAQ